MIDWYPYEHIQSVICAQNSTGRPNLLIAIFLSSYRCSPSLFTSIYHKKLSLALKNSYILFSISMNLSIYLFIHISFYLSICHHTTTHFSLHSNVPDKTRKRSRSSVSTLRVQYRLSRQYSLLGFIITYTRKLSMLIWKGIWDSLCIFIIRIEVFLLLIRWVTCHVFQKIPRFSLLEKLASLWIGPYARLFVLQSRFCTTFFWLSFM